MGVGDYILKDGSVNQNVDQDIARRELFEEIGIECQKMERKGLLKVEEGGAKLIVSIFHVEGVEAEIKVNQDEIERVEYWSLQEVRRNIKDEIEITHYSKRCFLHYFGDGS